MDKIVEFLKSYWHGVALVVAILVLIGATASFWTSNQIHAIPGIG